MIKNAVHGARNVSTAKTGPKSKPGAPLHRSNPASPLTKGAASPVSIPLSQQQAEQAKVMRKPVVHLLALSPLTEPALCEALPDLAADQVKLALSKIAEPVDEGRYELRRTAWKELDVWAYDYASQTQRQKVIDTAVKIYDRMRLGLSEPEWERLLPKDERGKGRCLSKLQASIASGTAQHRPPPKINVHKAEGGATPISNHKDIDHSSPGKTSETMAPASQQTSKAKKSPEKMDKKAGEGKKVTKPSIKPVIKPSVKSNLNTKTKAPLSAEFVQDSDDDAAESSAPKPVATKKVARAGPAKGEAPAIVKRHRDDLAEQSDPSGPTAKKVKRESGPSKTAGEPRPPKLVKKLASSSTTPVSSTAPKKLKTSAVTASTDLPAKAPKRVRRDDDDQRHEVNKKPKKDAAGPAREQYKKHTSPHKSSPLASSPPANASELESHSSSDRTSSSGSPQHSLKMARHQKSSSVASSVSSNGTGTGTRHLKPKVLDQAIMFKQCYATYESLYRELQHAGSKDPDKVSTVWDMHQRLVLMKQGIMENVEAV